MDSNPFRLVLALGRRRRRRGGRPRGGHPRRTRRRRGGHAGRGRRGGRLGRRRRGRAGRRRRRRRGRRRGDGRRGRRGLRRGRGRRRRRRGDRRRAARGRLGRDHRSAARPQRESPHEHRQQQQDRQRDEGDPPSATRAEPRERDGLVAPRDRASARAAAPAAASRAAPAWAAAGRPPARAAEPARRALEPPRAVAVPARRLARRPPAGAAGPARAVGTCRWGCVPQEGISNATIGVGGAIAGPGGGGRLDDGTTTGLPGPRRRSRPAPRGRRPGAWAGGTGAGAAGAPPWARSTGARASAATRGDRTRASRGFRGPSTPRPRPARAPRAACGCRRRRRPARGPRRGRAEAASPRRCAAAPPRAQRRRGTAVPDRPTARAWRRPPAARPRAGPPGRSPSHAPLRSCVTMAEGCVFGEERPPRERLPEHDARAVDVGARVGRVVLEEDLRGEVRAAAAPGTRAGRLHAARAHDARHAVGPTMMHSGVSSAVKQLERLALGVPQVVQGAQPGQGVDQDPQRHLEGGPLGGARQLRPAHAVDEVGDDEHVLAADDHVPQAPHVRVLERRHPPGVADPVGDLLSL